MSASRAPTQEDGTSVFLSYSRRDEEFVARLAQELSARGFDVSYDRSKEAKSDPDRKLTAQDEWWSQLQTMIASADVMVLVVTSHSAASPVCADEIAYAKHCGKRIVPILRTAIDFREAPEELGRLNVQLDFTRDDPEVFSSAIANLSDEINTDITWHREMTRLARRAGQWEANDRPEGDLLRQETIDSAENLLSRRPRSAPDEFPALAEFLEASRKREADDRRHLLTIIGRAYVKPARRALDDGQFETALRYAGAGMLLSEDMSMSLAPERDTEGRLRLAAFLDRTRLVLRVTGKKFDHVAFDSSGERVAASHAGRDVYIWNLKIAKLVPRLRDCGHNGAIRSIAISPDGECVLTTADDKLAKLSTMQPGLETMNFAGHSGAVLCGEFSPDGQLVVTGSDDATARIWDVVTGKQLHLLKGHEAAVASCCFSPDGRRVLTGSHDRTARIWDALKGRQIARIAGHSGWVLGACWSPDGKAVVTASADHSLHIWDARNGKPIVRLTGHTHRVNSVAFSPDGKRIVSASDDFTACVWDASSGAVLQVLRGHINNVADVRFSPDGRLIVTASHDNTIRTWDAAVSTAVWRTAVPGSTMHATIAFALDGVRVTMGDGEEIVLDRTTGSQRSVSRNKKKRTVSGPHEQPTGIPSPDGRRLALIESLGEASVRDRDTGETVRLDLGLNPSVAHICWSADGTRLLTGSRDGVARVWDAAGRLIASTEADPYEVKGIGFSFGGERFFTIGSQPFASIWDTESGALIARPGDGRQIAGAFSEDGRFMLLLSEGGEITLHDVARTQALAGAAGSVLTAALGNGKGVRPATEKRDLLLQDAPADLHAAMTEAMTAGLDDAAAAVASAALGRRIDLLSAPLHPKCYSSVP